MPEYFVEIIKHGKFNPSDDFEIDFVKSMEKLSSLELATTRKNTISKQAGERVRIHIHNHDIKKPCRIM